MAARKHTSTAVEPDRGQVLQEGRDAAVARRRADSQRCRARVAEVIEMMRRARTPLSDAEITRRAWVNRQYLQRHRDLKARAAKIRADLDGDAARAAVAARSEREAALAAENGMLVEQNAQLRRDLETARAELRTLRVQELATSAAGVLAGRLPGADATVEHLRGERDEALAALRSAEADLAALRILNQRLMVENSHLLQAAEHPPDQIGARVLHIQPVWTAERVRQPIDSPVTPRPPAMHHHAIHRRRPTPIAYTRVVRAVDLPVHPPLPEWAGGSPGLEGAGP